MDPGKANTMKCPRCEAQLGSTEVEGIEIEECASCGGTWFEEEELRKAKDHADADLVWMDFEIWDHPERFDVSLKPVRCPRCNIDMAAVEYDTTEIEIDYCLRCQGIWLDPGEFEKIIAALEEELKGKDIPEYISASLNEAKEILAGPESVISEWRDLQTVLRMLSYRVLTENPRVAKALAAIQATNPFK
jgi:Zn-finger nucleic acid-binding protein